MTCVLEKSFSIFKAYFNAISKLQKVSKVVIKDSIEFYSDSLVIYISPICFLCVCVYISMYTHPEYSLEGLMLKLQYFGHLMRRGDLLEKTLMLGKIEGRRRRQQQRMR